MAEMTSTDPPRDTQPGNSPAPDQAEQRARPRYACGSVTLARLALSATEATYFAWVHDLSEDGIGLDVLTPLAPGVDIVFNLKNGPEDAPIRLYAQVIHATSVGPFYRVGCRFVRPLQPWMLGKLLQHLRGSDWLTAGDDQPTHRRPDCVIE
jgi:PilZ domain